MARLKKFRAASAMTAVIFACAFAAITFFLRHSIYRLGESESAEEGRRFAALCAGDIEELFQIRSVLLRELSEEAEFFAKEESAFQKEVASLEKDFQGDLFALWPAVGNGFPQGIWSGEEESLEVNSWKSTLSANPGKAGKFHLQLFSNPNGVVSALLVFAFDWKGQLSYLGWKIPIQASLHPSLVSILGKDYEVTILQSEKKFALYTGVDSDSQADLYSARASILGEDLKIELKPRMATLIRRYDFVAYVVTILGLILALGGAAVTYFESARTAQLKEDSSRDPLTNLRNRRAFNDLIERETAIAQRYQRPLCLLILDLDHFKKINDTLGHASGDQVLQIAADTIQNSIRDTDVAFRFGGEEFAVIMAETNLLSAGGIAERIRIALEKTPFHTSKGKIHCTVSIGITGYRPGEAIDDLISRADMALYKAKGEGRNRVVTERPAGWEL